MWLVLVKGLYGEIRYAIYLLRQWKALCVTFQSSFLLLEATLEVVTKHLDLWVITWKGATQEEEECIRPKWRRNKLSSTKVLCLGVCLLPQHSYPILTITRVILCWPPLRYALFSVDYQHWFPLVSIEATTTSSCQCLWDWIYLYLASGLHGSICHWWPFLSRPQHPLGHQLLLSSYCHIHHRVIWGFGYSPNLCRTSGDPTQALSLKYPHIHLFSTALLPGSWCKVSLP